MGAGASANRNTENKYAYSMTTDNIDRWNEDNGLAVVAGIDFGTSYSGYAFSLKGSLDVISTQKHGGRLPKDRVPTVILLNPDQTFNSFGYDAIETYSGLSVDVRPRYFYFENFKMFLYETMHGKATVNLYTLHLRAVKEMGLKDVAQLEQLPYNQWPKYLQTYIDSDIKHNSHSRFLRIKDTLKKEIDAQQLFSLAFKYFRDLAVETVDLSTHGLNEKYIQWMIGIPAVWSDTAKHFMRQAAKDAGMRPENLRLVLEPEAASLFCEEHAVVASGNTLDRLPVGHKYILADLGGGTADICVHEIMSAGRLRELYRATGGDFGGNTVNKEFEIFISNVVGCGVWKEFKKTHWACYCDLKLCFETKKREFRMDTTNVIFKLEPSLISLCETSSNETFSSIVSKCKHSTSVEYKTNLGKLFINRSKMEEFFDHSLCGIIQTLRHIVQSCKTDNITTLLLVGGYAESQYIREKIKSAFPNFRFMLPSDSRLAVLKGTVMMGYKPRNIVERRSRFTYGFCCNEAFLPGEHPRELRLINDGEEMCRGVFVKMIEKNQLVNYGDTFTWEGHYSAVDMHNKHIARETALWRSCHSNPRFCLDKEGSELLGIEDQFCEKVGKFVIKPPHEGWPNYWNCETQLIVGETELIVKFINKNTGQVYETNMNFF
ncbi:HS12A-like protein [Mya arenaria]|uniref:HS12A-like protein n=1 Tax=Mya arenaria TaxID=6604 RepID=A0ABY7ELR3_MYAAR|nr:HS12A-like protein [Mya arenaria]